MGGSEHERASARGDVNPLRETESELKRIRTTPEVKRKGFTKDTHLRQRES